MNEQTRNEILARTDHNIEEVQIETTEEEREEGISLDDMLNEIEDIDTRGGSMMTFNNYRKTMATDGENWGTKVFFKSIVDIGLLKRCDDTPSSQARYCPTDNANENMPELFYYDPDNNIWGFSIENIERVNIEIRPTLTARAIEVRELILEEEELKRRASQVANRTGRTRLF